VVSFSKGEESAEENICTYKTKSKRMENSLYQSSGRTGVSGRIISKQILEKSV
jgi:hypothetical protein